MAKRYIIGHKNPDTDAIAAALSYADLKRQLGEDWEAGRLGPLNEETKYAMRTFGLENPDLLTDARCTIAEIELDEPVEIGRGDSCNWAYEMASGSHTRTLFVTEEHRLLGVVSMSDLTSIRLGDMDRRLDYLSRSPLELIAGDLEGILVYHNPTRRNNGVVMIYESGMNDRYRDTILLVRKEKHLSAAVKKHPAVIIFAGENAEEESLKKVTDKGISLIVTAMNVENILRIIYEAIPVEFVMKKQYVSCGAHEYIDDIRGKIINTRYRSYPVLDEEDKVVGTLSRYHLIDPRRKKIVLVDHNEAGQSVSGLDQAEIIAVIDHHRLADIQTGNPIFVRNEPIGSTTSIIASMYQERGLMPSPNLAGLMAAAIISDTVMFKSPTCTTRDKLLAERLARHAGVDLDELGRAMFSCGISVDKPVSDLIKYDQKEFHLGSHSLAVSQIMTVDSDPFVARKDEIIQELEILRAEKKYDLTMVMITNVLKEGTELLFAGDTEAVCSAFNIDEVPDHHIFLPQILSRKKQIVPALSQIWG